MENNFSHLSPQNFYLNLLGIWEVLLMEKYIENVKKMIKNNPSKSVGFANN